MGFDMGGVRLLKHRLVGASARAQADAVQLCHVYGRRGTTVARQRVPVATGALRDAITYHVEQSGHNASITWEADSAKNRSGKPYAIHVEMGNPNRAPRPFLGPMLDEIGPQFGQDLRKIGFTGGTGAAMNWN